MLRLLAILCVAAHTHSAEPQKWEKLPPLPEPLGVAAPFAGVSGGALLVAGGANFPDKMPWEGGKKVWHDRVWVLDQPTGAWREAGRLPRALGYGVSITARDSVVCVGGSDADRHYPDAFRLIWKNGTLAREPLPPLPIALANASAALAGDTLFVACGAENPGELAATTRAFALDLAASKPAWRELPALPGKPRFLATGATHQGAFYVFGGCALEPGADGKTSRVYLHEAWKYLAADGWQRLSDLPRPSVAAPAPAPFVDGQFLLLAGDDGSLTGFRPLEKHPGFPGSILAYDPVANRWSEPGKVPAPRATVPCVEWRGRFIVPSGEARPGVRSPEVWALTPR